MFIYILHTPNSGYTFFISICVPWESNPQPFDAADATLYHWATQIRLKQLIQLQDWLYWWHFSSSLMCDLGMWSGPSRALFINDTLFPVFCPRANNNDTECSILILINFVLNAFLLCFLAGRKLMKLLDSQRHLLRWSVFLRFLISELNP